MQQPLTTLLTTANGTSHITETIYENRFKNVQYLNQMGADIEINDIVMAEGIIGIVYKDKIQIINL
mgnify:CR=1 FL=1